MEFRDVLDYSVTVILLRATSGIFKRKDFHISEKHRVYLAIFKAILIDREKTDNIRRAVISSLMECGISLKESEKIFSEIILDSKRKAEYIPRKKDSLQEYLRHETEILMENLPEDLGEALFYKLGLLFKSYLTILEKSLSGLRNAVILYLDELSVEKYMEENELRIVLNTLADIHIPEKIDPVSDIRFTVNDYNTVKSVEKAMKRLPPDATVYNLLGVFFLYYKNLPRAKTYFEKALIADEKYMSAIYNLAVYYLFYREDIAKAYDYIVKLQQLNREMSEIQYLYGVYCVRHKDYNRALEHFKSAVNIKPDYAIAWNDMGTVYKEIGMPEQAVSCYLRAIEINNTIALYWNNLGVVYRIENRQDYAEQCFKTAIQLKEDFAEAYSNLAIIYGDMGDIDREIHYYYQALRYNPRLAMAWNNLGAALAQKNMTEDAKECFKRALSIDAKLEPARKNLEHLGNK